MMEIYRTQNIA